MVWETRRRELKSAPYELFVMLVTVLSILNLVLMYVVQDRDLDTVLLVMNGLLSTILGFGKDALARRYVSLSSQRHVPTLDLSALFAGTEG